MLQADNGNYSPSIVPLMPCHLHVSWGVLCAQSHSVVGTSQEILKCERSGRAVTDTTLARTKEWRSPSCSPWFSSNQDCAFKKPTFLIQSLNVQVEHVDCKGVRESLGCPTVQELGARKIALNFKNNQNEPPPLPKKNQTKPPTFSLFSSTLLRTKGRATSMPSPVFLHCGAPSECPCPLPGYPHHHAVHRN